MYVVFTLLGAIFGSWAIFNIFQFIFYRFFDIKTVISLAFAAAVIAILAITNFTIGMNKGFMYYIPVLFLCFLWDLRKFSKPQNEKKPSAHHE